MSKIKQCIIYVSVFATIIFIIPALCTKQTKSTIANAKQNNKEKEEIQSYHDYTKYGTIK